MADPSRQANPASVLQEDRIVRIRNFRSVDAAFPLDDSWSTMVVWGVVSSEIERVIEFFGSRDEAERMLADVLRGEPDGADAFRIERIELGQLSLN